MNGHCLQTRQVSTAGVNEAGSCFCRQVLVHGGKLLIDNLQFSRDRNLMSMHCSPTRCPSMQESLSSGKISYALDRRMLSVVCFLYPYMIQRSHIIQCTRLIPGALRWTLRCQVLHQVVVCGNYSSAPVLPTPTCKYGHHVTAQARTDTQQPV